MGKRYEFVQQVRLGWWEPEVTVQQAEANLGDFFMLLYFGVEQSDKLRGCMDPEELTTVSALLETVYMCGLDGIAAMLNRIRDEWGEVELEFCKEDWKAGFRQLHLHLEHRRYFVATAVNEDNEIVCFVSF